ncbi:AMP-binding protein [Shewanella woodyi]|uniref:AMP-dependent synthetase and ligase n=1 Tax=Shewanella woodyi (strain ATCC 51908 / MS32) TaxID=392500 RepID=B1KGY1_SHEWM|nr:AMP-binding protein [Shewanella woodyi]ACA88293.1 AMP-dependent synthetase and ligase [Shewanella woodyi ATCC 51908]
MEQDLTRQSYKEGEGDAVFINGTIGQTFDCIASQHPNAQAIVVKHQNISWNYRLYHQKVTQFAAGLLQLNVKPGDRVAIWAPNCIEWCIAQFATAKIGAVLVCINPAYRISELSYSLKKVGCKVLITATNFKSSDYLEMIETIVPELKLCSPGELTSENFPLLKSVIQMGDKSRSGMFGFDEVSDYCTDELIEKVNSIGQRLSPDDAINIQFTSGTTGEPKGATLTHSSILNNGFQVGEKMRLTYDDKLCIPVPLYHCFGMVMGNLACITHGCSAVFPSDSFDPIACLEAIDEYRCTALHGVPTMFIAILNEPEFNAYDLTSLRTGIMAGALCPIETIKKVIGDMNMKHILIAYGQTETSPVSHMTGIDDAIEKRVTTVGKIGPGLEVKLVNQNGETVPIGVEGEICIRGYAVMKGYWEDEQKTKETISQDGWLHSGDLGEMDNDNYLKVTGRMKDMIIRGGENIYPREIENFLYTHPTILDVQVFGIKDDKYGESVCAWIICKKDRSLTVQEVQDFCKDSISHFKIPEHISFVTKFPMTVTGKIQKFVMRDMMEKRH